MKSLNEATTFTEMLELIKCANVNNEPFYIRAAVKTFLFFGGYASSNVNAAYYLFYLKQDIEKFAIDKGYFLSLKESKEASSAPRVS